MSRKSGKPSAFGSGRFWRPSKPTVSRRVGQKNTHSEKRKLPKTELVLKEYTLKKNRMTQIAPCEIAFN